MKLFTALLSTMALLTLTFAAAAADPVRRVTPQGHDSDDMHYLVTCRDKSAGSIIVRALEDKICAAAPRKARRCEAGWSLSDAAHYVCAAAQE